MFDGAGMVLTDDPPLYRDLLRLKPDGVTPNGWAVKAGVSRTVWSDMRRHGNPSRRTLEKLLVAANSSLAEFEALRIGAPEGIATGPAPEGVGDARSLGWRGAPLSPIPHYRTSPAGDWEGDVRPIEVTGFDPDSIQSHVDRPQSLAADREAYALTVIGDSMWPRFRPGRCLLVSPAAAVAVGDDVVLRLRQEGDGPARVLIKEMTRRTSRFVELRQFNPDAVFRVDASQVASLHKVVGEAI